MNSSTTEILLPSISIIIPVKDEREAIAETLHALVKVFDARGGEYEIIAVDDGSTDGSAEIIAQAGPHVRLIRHEENRGYGAALKSGFAIAQYDYLAFLDADGSYPPADFALLFPHISEVDMVVGERRDYDRHSSIARRHGKAAVLVPLAQYLTGRQIPDLNSGMRIVKKSLVERYWPLLPDGFSLTTTLTMSFLCSGRNVLWVPIHFAQRKGKSKISPMRDMTSFVILIFRTVTYFRPLRVYLPLSFLLVIASVAIVLISKIVTHQVMDVAALFLFIAGLQLLLIGVLGDLIMKLLGTRR